MTTCKGSNKLVSKAVIARAIFTESRGWIAYCERCGHAASFARAEVKPDGHGYNRRYAEHNEEV